MWVLGSVVLLALERGFVGRENGKGRGFGWFVAIY